MGASAAPVFMMKKKQKKQKKKIDQISINGFYLILAGVVFSVIFNTGVIDPGVEIIKWIGFFLMLAGMVLMMIPAVKDSRRRREERRKEKENQNL